MATIRSLTPADYPAVAALAAVAARQGLIGRPLWETGADVAAEAGAPGRRSFLVADDEEGALAGFAGYRLRTRGEAEVYGPLVTDEGAGIGAWLESRVTSLAAQEGAAEFSMLIGLENRSGQAWAEWRGYLRDSETPEQLLTWLHPGEPAPVRAVAGVTVRPAAEGDLERIEWLVEESFAYRRTQPSTWLASAWVLETDGRVAGCLRMVKATARMDYLCIDPALRRQGLGAFLLSEVVRRFWAEEPRRVCLGAPLDSAGAQALVRRLGFRQDVAVARWVKR